MARQVAKTVKPGPAKPANQPKAVGPVVPTPPVCQLLPADEIRRRAYLKWEAAGKPPGDGAKFWLDAEQELLQGK